MFIKICGVKDPEIAAFAAQSGAHYIGMILTPGFRRSVTLAQGRKIAEAARDNGAVPVGVFVAANSLIIESSCRGLGIELVQAYQLSSGLPEHFNRIFINETEASLRPGRDFLLMEGRTPGSGEKIDDSSFAPPLIRPWLIAGGLNPENVKETILRYRPDGVDVSSGVEKEGMKNPECILKFIEEAKSAC